MSDASLISQSEGSWRFEDLKTWTGDDHKDYRKGVSLGFEDTKTWTRDDHKDFIKDVSLVFEERSVLKVLVGGSKVSGTGKLRLWHDSLLNESVDLKSLKLSFVQTIEEALKSR